MARRYVRYTDEQVIHEAEHLITTLGTYSAVARDLCMRQSTVWFHLNRRLKKLNPDKYDDVHAITSIPRKVRAHMKKGGES